MVVRDPTPIGHRIYRRRRAAVTIAGVSLLALLLAILSSHGGGGAHTTAKAAARALTKPKRTPAEARALTRGAEERAITHVLSYAPAITSGGGHGDEVALTFDDGPGPYTRRVVRALDRYRVRATFFAIGEEERWFSAGTKLELRSGDVIGDHTETHPMMASLPSHQQYEQVLEQIAHIELLDGPRPRLFRPPYGSFDAKTFRVLHKLGLLMVLWSTDTSDYALPGAAAIVKRALAGAHPGAIILMHDGGGDRSETVAALPAIISGLRRKGLHPVTIPRLMLDDPPPPGRPIPTSLAGD
jgi:peptidoglycan-N-acetylglucosamine deacetylase